MKIQNVNNFFYINSIPLYNILIFKSIKKKKKFIKIDGNFNEPPIDMIHWIKAMIR